MKLQNNLLFSNVKCTLQNIFLEWNLLVASKLLDDFLFKEKKIAHAFNLFDYNLRISIHLQVGSYCLFYRLQIRGTQEI